jgi:hypothetical protein
VSGSHTYNTPGAYVVAITVTDDNGGATTASADAAVAVYSATQRGFVVGAGVVSSPSQAYTPANTSDPNHRGLAGFAYLAFQPSSGSPVGATFFALADANMYLTSVGVSSLTFSSSSKAYYTGTAKVNGVSGYSVLVSSVDGGWLFGDKLRIKVWNTSSGTVLYDNQYGAADSASATQPVYLGAIVVRT